MAMTVAEAQAAQDLIAWVLGLRVWEHDPYTADAPPSDQQVTSALVYLAGRSRKTLAAGLDTAHVVNRCAVLFPDAQPATTTTSQETPA